MKKADPPIIIEETFETPIENVWKAITEANQMQQWFFQQIDSFKAESGFSSSFLVEANGRKFTHLWDVVSVKTSDQIKYRWRYKEYQGDSYVTFKLQAKDLSKTKLTLIAEVEKDFPSDVPEFKRESCISGWNYFIKESLKNYLNS
jgi:uncharacterized protein YndB with AHSA1/START domain